MKTAHIGKYSVPLGFHYRRVLPYKHKIWTSNIQLFSGTAHMFSVWCHSWLWSLQFPPYEHMQKCACTHTHTHTKQKSKLQFSYYEHRFMKTNNFATSHKNYHKNQSLLLCKSWMVTLSEPVTTNKNYWKAFL
jgi:hypothetical protein